MITKIPLTEQGDTIIVQQSGAEPLGVILTLHDSHGKGTSNVDASPPECDALIAAIGRALGRPAPTSTPLEERIANAATDALAGFGKDTDKDDWTWANGCEAGLRAALAMVREQGATVPRAGVAAVVAEIDALECADEDAILWIRRSLAALLAAPTAPPEKG